MGDVTDDYGRRVGMALKAVRQLHADASRLLLDCDGTIGKGLQVCPKGNVVTGDMSTVVGGTWMAEGAYRYYAAPTDNEPGRVDGVCLCFIGEAVAADEPVLIVGQVDYRLPEGQDIQKVWSAWDLWFLFTDNCQDRTYGHVLSAGPITWKKENKTFDGFRLIAVPLYSIMSMGDIVVLMDKVRAATPAAGPV